MDHIGESKQALIDAIRESSLYREYEACARALAAEPEKQAAVDAFRIKSLQYQTSGNGDDHASLQNIISEKVMLRQDPVIASYLDAELALCRVLQEIYMDIAGAVDLHVEGLGGPLH